MKSIENKVRDMKDIIDVVNMIERYDIKDSVYTGRSYLIPESEFQRVLSEVKNKRYWIDLQRGF